MKGLIVAVNETIEILLLLVDVFIIPQSTPITREKQKKSQEKEAELKKVFLTVFFFFFQIYKAWGVYCNPAQSDKSDTSANEFEKRLVRKYTIVRASRMQIIII